MTLFTPRRYADEYKSVGDLAAQLDWDDGRAGRVQASAQDLLTRADLQPQKIGSIDQFLKQYRLSSIEGLALIGLAEALLRVPDTHTRNQLIRDKITAADWLMGQLETSDLVVRAARVGLFITKATLSSLVGRLGEPVIRAAVLQAIKLMGQQFVLGETMAHALRAARPDLDRGYAFSFDMLGEGARTAPMADDYFKAYMDAITTLAEARDDIPLALKGRMGISVKLSALHPRYTPLQEEICRPALVERLLELARAARRYDLNLTVDAEETERLTLSLEIIRLVARDPSIYKWDGLGLAIQAYQKYAPDLVRHVLTMGVDTGHRLRVRLVKGAYWDTEIKRAQIMGLPDYPLWTRKANTDLSYLVCAQMLFKAGDAVYPMLATHNAHTVASVLDLAAQYKRGLETFEFQRLHGMGEALHHVLVTEGRAQSTLYAPVGTHEHLLAYLVRRLIENGANSSFVHQMATKDQAATSDPYRSAVTHSTRRHRALPLPAAMFVDRKNSRGHDLAQLEERGALLAATVPTIETVAATSEAMLDQAVDGAAAAFPTWNATPALARAAILDRFADHLEEQTGVFIHLLQLEGRKTLADALAEVREAVDFARYYAAEARQHFTASGVLLPGPTGEENRLVLEGRGVFACISPWNFPLAIFVGQVVAALAAGNTVVAKPAEQTPMIAMRAIELLHLAGIPKHALFGVVGDGLVGAALVRHPLIAGVAFTGSTEAARSINRTLANKNGPIVPLIAETGGQNVMIVDSTALIEAACDDIILSAFGSAGQRCSALRVLYVQHDIADRLIDMVGAAMQELRVGDPRILSTDVGPVIDDEAYERLRAHSAYLDRIGAKCHATTPMAADLVGPYLAPRLVEVETIDQLPHEVFGPILHVIRFASGHLDKIIDAMTASGYGLTFGIQTRLSTQAERLARAARVGNVYVNRSMIGAVVGVQPFGGMGLSGTGPKAGGPHYLPRFAQEKVISVNTAAAGGNVTLIAGSDD